LYGGRLCAGEKSLIYDSSKVDGCRGRDDVTRSSKETGKVAGE
jgi:hypothetical protein